jgi:hypothetical protein
MYSSFSSSSFVKVVAPSFSISRSRQYHGLLGLEGLGLLGGDGLGLLGLEGLGLLGGDGLGLLGLEGLGLL